MISVLLSTTFKGLFTSFFGAIIAGAMSVTTAVLILNAQFKKIGKMRKRNINHIYLLLHYLRKQTNNEVEQYILDHRILVMLKIQIELY